MALLARLFGHDVLERRVKELSASVEELATRVTTLEERIPPSPAHTCRDWRAWHDRMPGSPPTLHVRGRCEFPTSGFGLRLQRHEPQGTNPRDLLLELKITAPTGPVTQVVTETEVHYAEEAEVNYDSVTILPDGPTIDVTVTS